MSKTMPPYVRDPDYLADYRRKGDMMLLLVMSSNQKKTDSLAGSGLKLTLDNDLSRRKMEMSGSSTCFRAHAAQVLAFRRGSDSVLR
jgi:hypothetical protein